MPWLGPKWATGLQRSDLMLMIKEFLSAPGMRDIQVVLSASELETVLRKVLSDLLSKQEEEKINNTMLSRNAVRDRLHVDNSTLWRWDKTGYLKAIHIGRAVYYKESDVKDIEEGRI